MKYTERQLEVMNASEPVVEINSPPGSGKTATILGIVENNKEKKTLVVCFNSSIKEELVKKAAKKELENAEFFTFHGLAHKFFKEQDIIKEFAKRDFSQDFDYFSVKKIVETVHGPATPRDILGIKNTLLDFFQSDYGTKDFFGRGNEYKYFSKILKYINDNPESPMFHCYYIKLFQLINKKLDYDMVLVDEAQDKSGCYAAMIKNMSISKEFYFGDSFQMIYGFNGAIGMNISEYRLDRSFRLGSESAAICNRLINDFIDPKDEGFIGVNENQFVVDKLPQFEQRTIICRTNNRIIEYLDYCVKAKKYCYIIGGKESIGLGEIKKFVTEKENYTYRGYGVKDKRAMEELYAESRDGRLKMMIETMKKLRINTLSDITRLERYVLDDPKDADYIFTTVHKSKGMEFKNVEIADDFKPIKDLYSKHEKGISVADEIYVLYVALSRSCGNLKLNADLEAWHKGKSATVIA